MTLDFRDPERALRGASAAPVLAPPQKVVLLALGGCAAAFLLAGVWLLLVPVAWLEPAVAPWVGLALVLSAVGDAVAVFLLRRIWLRAAKPPR